MSRILLLSAGLALILIPLTGCTGGAVPASSGVEEVFSGAAIKGIDIDLGAGLLEISPNSQGQIKVLSSGTPAQISQADHRLILSARDGKSGDVISLEIPDSLRLQIRSFAGDIRISDIQGVLDIYTTAGNINLVNFLGTANLRAGRGDVVVQGGRGELVLIGEHGVLSVSDFAGPISISTIMGAIQFQGAEGGVGRIQLESDHAPVLAVLPERTAYQIEIQSSGGAINCIGNNLRRTSSGCQGSTGDAADSFRIRTVSGRIDFRILPESGE